MPLVSVVIPVYNRAAVLPGTVQSVLRQTLADFEVVITDNCSTDDTWSVMQALAASDPRVRVFRNAQNLGPVRNWIEGVTRSTGKYVKILFSDDWLEPAALASLVEPLESDDTLAFTYSAVRAKAGDVEEVWYSQRQTGACDAMTYLWRHATDMETQLVSPSGALFRREDAESFILASIPRENGEECDRAGIGNDSLLFWLSAARRPWVYFVPRPQVGFAAPAAGQKSITASLSGTARGRWLLLSGRMSAFAYFLERSDLPPVAKRQMAMALVLQAIRPEHGRVSLRFARSLRQQLGVSWLTLGRPRVAAWVLVRAWRDARRLLAMIARRFRSRGG